MKYIFSGNSRVLQVRVEGNLASLKPVPFMIFSNPDIFLQGDKLVVKTATSSWETKFDGDHIASVNNIDWNGIAGSETNLNTINDNGISMFMDLLTQAP